MKAKEIQDLIDFIAKSGLNKVNIETEEFKISVQREPNQKVKYMSEPAPRAAAPQEVPAAAPQAAGGAPTVAAPPAAPAPASDESRYIAIKAPMIGTFYRSNSPESPSFVNVGDEMKQGQVICIIEAMKLFNEIESEVSGRIVKVLVDNASPVEYDQPLFLVDPS
ncbi:acetyl-CoA carboxylase biotin carboxyl carrier protein [Pontibacter sp. 172403-2]|uniref:acetyl-CoA carboxylase biotin carboxyl carrier protein n=1 Tax=Pontibacter rufus TaxID=2791028 RepID=UPI0018AF7959|nr:acetyl-CoA carboxylase biotin carboxyl carrier protein [Pontibacter sp. 172403-2]MBF9254657.1 acetyl-CoA carboxylase biotin carboxyl carrier protein [Pontibacter sp. 172403-2]